MAQAQEVDVYTMKLRLRRKYAGDLSGLVALSERVEENGACDAVTWTGHSYEGGSASGEVGLRPMDYLRAIEEVILEMDASLSQPSPMVVFSDFSSRPVQT